MGLAADEAARRVVERRRETIPRSLQGSASPARERWIDGRPGWYLGIEDPTDDGDDG